PTSKSARRSSRSSRRCSPRSRPGSGSRPRTPTRPSSRPCTASSPRRPGRSSRSPTSPSTSNLDPAHPPSGGGPARPRIPGPPMTYVTQRLLTFPLILLGVSVLVFFAIRLVPGDAITAMLGTEAGLLTPDQRAALAAYFGIDQPVHVQYWRWLTGLVRGDLGISVIYGRPVLAVILERFPLTLELALLSMLIALAVGIPAGVHAATHNERPSDLGVRVLAMIGQSTPNFVVGLLLIYVLSVYFGYLPTMGV